ncbi:hypothetical protein [Azospirillum tabaci]|uniref:hypothetical protein n=1 Tax=Azospirillum tabaci TaxID=2752310 RepID=UPI0016604E38|nr:hypothetical protein [Azospirillum tabaci]
MRDVPIIFSAPMVRALLDGRKTQTRRLATSPLAKVQPGDRLWVRENFATSDAYGDPAILGVEYAADGSTLAYANGELHYKEHGCAQYPGPWKPSIHMPRWASRLTLVVESMKVQRLQDISEEDARAEGATQRDTGFRECQMSVDGGQTFQTARWPADSWPMNWEEAEHRARTSPYAKRLADCALGSARMAFANYWRRLHGDDAWAANPFVVALTFTVHRSNIDKLEAREVAIG